MKKLQDFASGLRGTIANIGELGLSAQRRSSVEDHLKSVLSNVDADINDLKANAAAQVKAEREADAKADAERREAEAKAGREKAEADARAAAEAEAKRQAEQQQ